MRIQPKSWAEFQHYHDRNPLWIKLHKKLLDDFEFQGLPLASRALAPMLWLLCSEDKDGWLDLDIKKIAFRLRVSPRDVDGAIKPLIDGGFFVLEQVASELLADGKQNASPETERETQEKTETELFTEFWLNCPRKAGKGAAKRAYSKAILKTAPETIRSGIVRYSASRAGQPEEYTKHPATWLNAECWLDETKPPTGATIHVLSDEIRAKEQENLKRLGLI